MIFALSHKHLKDTIYTIDGRTVSHNVRTGPLPKWRREPGGIFVSPPPSPVFHLVKDFSGFSKPFFTKLRLIFQDHHLILPHII
jgi:hypothetical protein